MKVTHLLEYCTEQKSKKIHRYVIAVMVMLSAALTACEAEKNSETKPRVAYVTTLAGSGDPNHQDGPGIAARFYRPSSVAVTSDGTVYVADSGSNHIRKIEF